MCEINILPIERWRIAHVIRFRFPCLSSNILATAIYLRPFVGQNQQNDEIDSAIISAIEAEFGEVTHLEHNYNYEVVGENDILAHYLNGGASIEFVIRFFPIIHDNDVAAYENVRFNVPSLHFNLSLMTNPDPNNIPAFHTSVAELPMEHFEEYVDRIRQIETR